MRLILRQANQLDMAPGHEARSPAKRQGPGSPGLEEKAASFQTLPAGRLPLQGSQRLLGNAPPAAGTLAKRAHPQTNGLLDQSHQLAIAAIGESHSSLQLRLVTRGAAH